MPDISPGLQTRDQVVANVLGEGVVSLSRVVQLASRVIVWFGER